MNAPPASSDGYVIAVDNGSQSTKVSIFDAAGRVHASARVPLQVYDSPAPGRWEHPGDDLWESIVRAIRAALDAFAGDPSEIRGMGLCTIRFCRAVLRADGTLAQPVMSWMDERVSRAYAEEAPDAEYVTTSSGYIGHRLTGRLVDTAGNAQGCWPVDQARWDWSDGEADYERCGTPREKLFDLVPPGTVLGPMTAEAAALTGLPAGMPVVATSNDKAVEALGAGLRSEDEVLVSLGTYVSAMTTASGAPPEHPAYWTNFGAEPGVYLVESEGIRRGMWTVSWFRDLVAGASEADLEHGAAQVAPGSGGLVVSLDWLAPDDAPGRRGAIVGFDGTQGRFHVHRAIVEALAITMGGSVGRMCEALGRTPRAVILTGGGAASELILSVFAAVVGVPVRRPETVDAAGVGAAISAAVAVGMHADWDAAVDAMVRPGLQVDPDPGLVEAYRRVRADYERVIPRIRELLS